MKPVEETVLTRTFILSEVEAKLFFAYLASSTGLSPVVSELYYGFRKIFDIPRCGIITCKPNVSAASWEEVDNGVKSL